jgi:hypothetical protein
MDGFVGIVVGLLDSVVGSAQAVVARGQRMRKPERKRGQGTWVHMSPRQTWLWFLNWNRRWRGPRIAAKVNRTEARISH